MSEHTIRTGCFHAVLDPMTGVGLLVLPDFGDDLACPFDSSGQSVQDADWRHMCRQLDAANFEPLDGEDGDWMHETTLPDGRQVVALHGLDPIVTEPSLFEVQESRDRLLATLVAVA